MSVALDAHSVDTLRPLIAIRGLSKRFGATQALNNVDLDIAGGRVHALLGINGCGKSTLVKVLAGFHKADTGEIEWKVRESERAIAFVHQDLGLVPTLSVTENIALTTGFESKGAAISWRREHARARRILADAGVDCDVEAAIGALGPADQTMVAIARALSSLPANGGVLVLDEPTARLPASEADRLLQMIRGLKKRGVGILYISHRLDEVLDIGDDISILRDGRKVFSGPAAGLDRKSLVKMIVGREVEHLERSRSNSERIAARPVLLQTANLSGLRVQDVDLDIREGEIVGIVGIVGLVGSGRSELGRLIFGLQQPTGGHVALAGQDITRKATGDIVELGVGYVPQERREGIFRGLSVGENAILADMRGLMGSLALSMTRLQQAADEVVRQFQVKTDGTDVAIETLSGGNQQKVSLGKWLRRDGVRVLILDEPTQGIDIGARTEIFNIVRRQAAERGIAALVLDSDLDVLAEHCDRVLVMVRGRLVRTFTGSELTASALSHEIYGH